jgi:hypothetical protein
MALDRDDTDERLARLEKLMREAGRKPAAEAAEPRKADANARKKAAQAKAASPPPDSVVRRRSKRR